MGFFDSLLGLGSSSATQQAAQQGTAALMGGLQSGNRALRQGASQANDALTANTKLGLGSLDKGYDSAIAALGDYGAKAQGLLSGGVKDAVGTVLNGNDAYKPYVATGGAANTMLGDALGLNGPAGSDAALSAFQTSPGYAFQRDEANDATARKMASLGLAGSGGTLDALLRQSSRLADTEYGSWLNNLQSAGAQGLTAAAGISGNNQAAGGYQYGGGTAGAQLAQQLGSSVGTAHIGKGTGEAGLYGDLGQGLSANDMNLGRSLSANDMSEALGVAGLGMQSGQAQDNVTSANNGVLSKLFGSVLGMPLGGTSLSTPSAAGGFSVTPGANGSLSFAPSASQAGTSGGGIFGPLMTKFGTSLANAVKL